MSRQRVSFCRESLGVGASFFDDRPIPHHGEPVVQPARSPFDTNTAEWGDLYTLGRWRRRYRWL